MEQFVSFSFAFRGHLGLQLHVVRRFRHFEASKWLYATPMLVQLSAEVVQIGVRVAIDALSEDSVVLGRLIKLFHLVIDPFFASAARVDHSKLLFDLFRVLFGTMDFHALRVNLRCIVQALLYLLLLQLLHLLLLHLVHHLHVFSATLYILKRPVLEKLTLFLDHTFHDCCVVSRHG